MSSAADLRIDLTVERHVLGNGLTVLVAENHAAPTFCYMTWFKVGSRNERPGITGISHLFEHMMFNGSDRFGPKVFDKLIESNGGYSNGSTWYDFTNYHEEVASEGLETVLDLESDRMRSLLLTPENLEQERSIVKEERRQRTDNSTEGTMFELLMANAFIASPYRWPVVGWEADLNNISLPDCREYFRTYYAPNNALVVIVGDVDTRKTIDLMEKYFGGIPPQAPPRPVVDAEPVQKGEKRILHKMVAELPAVMIGYKAVPFLHEDFVPLDLARCILTEGDSSRLYRSLIYDKQIANEASVHFRPSLDPNLFLIYAQAREEADPASLVPAIDDVLARIIAGEIDEREIRKAKNQIRVETIKDLKDNAGRTELLGAYELMAGDWRGVFATLAKVEQVTKDEIRGAAARCFNPDRRTVVTLLPEDAE